MIVYINEMSFLYLRYSGPKSIKTYIFNNILIVMRYDFSKFLEKVTLLR